ncbi:hypothetical protein [Streptomyces syringium]|uniref:hypothetical protein n=1 Tax=Streptomyces syringium TaxID=76729 RepID=UPI003455201A
MSPAAWYGLLIFALIGVVLGLLAGLPTRNDEVEQESTAPEPGTGHRTCEALGHHVHDEGDGR